MSNIKYKIIPLDTLHVQVERILFGTGAGANEIHAMVHLTPDFPADQDPIDNLLEAKMVLEQFLGARTFFGRLFLSQEIAPREGIKGLSCIIQPPLDGTPAALMLWMLQGAPNSAYTHSFRVGQSAPSTLPLLEQYKEELNLQHLKMSENCMRTWFFVRDIDHNYQELVDTRREFFQQEGLTPETHYIASTGINGSPLCPLDNVQLDSYTVRGLQPDQVRYLQGKSHLNPTYEYGVTFERGTRIEYGDRCHLLISGTASIDNQGNILYPNDPEQQTRRMLENIQVLLDEGGASLRDLMHGIVYLRRAEDFPIVQRVLQEVVPDLPKVYLLAPVCRPGWLVEMEGIAVIPNRNPLFPSF